MIIIDTIGKAMASRYHVYGFCRECGHNAEVDLLALAVAKGEDYPLAKVRQGLRCSKCGTTAEYRLIYEAPSPRAN